MKKLVVLILLSQALQADYGLNLEKFKQNSFNFGKTALGLNNPKNLISSIKALDIEKVKSFVASFDRLSEQQKQEVFDQIKMVEKDLKNSGFIRNKIFNSLKLSLGVFWETIAMLAVFSILSDTYNHIDIVKLESKKYLTGTVFFYGLIYWLTQPNINNYKKVFMLSKLKSRANEIKNLVESKRKA